MPVVLCIVYSADFWKWSILYGENAMNEQKPLWWFVPVSDLLEMYKPHNSDDPVECAIVRECEEKRKMEEATKKRAVVKK